MTNAVVLCADAGYFPFAYLLATQLAEDPLANYDIYIFTEKGAHLSRVPPDTPFVIQTPDISAGLPIEKEFWDSVSVPIFGCARLFAPSILKHHDRILYLDTDIRLNASVTPLFGLDLKGNTIAAFGEVVTHPSLKAKRGWENKLAKIGVKPENPFFNSGVLLIDAAKWRENRMTEVALACIERLGTNLYDIDQDCLNVIFQNAWTPISPRWNFIPTPLDAEVRALLEPVIFHNIRGKPWRYDCADKNEVRAFKAMLAKSPFRDIDYGRPTYRDVKGDVERFIKSMLIRLTPFLPSSRQRLAARALARDKSGVVAEIKQKVAAGAWEDYNQGISRLPTLG